MGLEGEGNWRMDKECVNDQLIEQFEVIGDMLQLVDEYLSRHQTGKAIQMMYAVNAVAEGIKKWPAVIYYTYIF